LRYLDLREVKFDQYIPIKRPIQIVVLVPNTGTSNSLWLDSRLSIISIVDK